MAFNAEANGKWRMCLPFASALKSAKPVAHSPNSIYHWGKMVLKSVVCNIDTRSPFAAPTSRGLPRTASAPHKGWARF